mgnify:FL=1
MALVLVAEGDSDPKQKAVRVQVLGAAGGDRTGRFVSQPVYLNIATIAISLRPKTVASGASPTSYHHSDLPTLSRGFGFVN